LKNQLSQIAAVDRRAWSGMRLFLSGNPAVGKTTLVRAVSQRLEEVTCAGFYTEEIRAGRQRTGFRIVTLDGQRATLASVGSQKPTVGKYSVHVEEFENLVLGRIDPAVTEADLYVIDEIGKMELLSDRFRAKIIQLLGQPANLLATISKKGNGLIEQIKRSREVGIVEVTYKNRDRLVDELVERIKDRV
jgi:nucleoside-triphosphatase